MRNTLIMLILFLLALIPGSKHTESANSEDLSLTINTNKKIFRPGSEIFVKVQIDNRSNSRIRLFNSLHLINLHMLRFEITGPGGRPVKGFGNDSDQGYEFYKNSIVTLYPRGFVGIYVNLMGQGQNHNKCWFVFDKKGTYKIKAFYNVPTYFSEMVKELGGNIWMGELTSNEITITLE